MKKATKIKYYIESLCIYDFKQDSVINALLNLLNSLDSDEVLEKQAEFFNTLSTHESLKHYVSKLILTADNVFTKAAAAGDADKLEKSIIEGVQSDLKKLEDIASITPSPPWVTAIFARFCGQCHAGQPAPQCCRSLTIGRSRLSNLFHFTNPTATVCMQNMPLFRGETKSFRRLQRLTRLSLPI